MSKTDTLRPEASVALAAYNGERFLARQLDSILNDLKANDELVVSYDASIDRTLELLEAYANKDSRMRVVKNLHPGIVGNFNNAIASCRGRYCFISDQDDIWLEGKRDTMISALNSTGASLAIHDGVHIDENDAVISESFFHVYRIGHGLIRNFAKPRYSGCCMAFTDDARKLIMPMPSSVINYDHWIGMVCELYSSVTFVDQILIHHRLHGANVTTSTRPLHVVMRQRLNLAIELIRRGRANRCS